MIVEDTEPDHEPEDICHVYSGYAPLSVRIVEALSKPGGMRAIEDALKLLPGPHFDLKQEMPKGFKPGAVTLHHLPPFSSTATTAALPVLG